MKILPAVKSIRSDIMAAHTKITKASYDGYMLASRTANIYKQNSARRYMNVTRSVCSKVSKTVTMKELPYIAAAIGIFIPLPFASPTMFALGFLARFLYSGK